MRWLLIFLLFPTFAFADKVKCEQNNMVWVEKWSDCVAADPCVGERSEYCSLFKANYDYPKIVRGIFSIYAKLNYDIDKCDFNQVGEDHYACKSDENYVVFVSPLKLSEIETEETKQDKGTSSYSTYGLGTERENLNRAVVQVCKMLGGKMDDTWSKKPDYKKEGLCIGSSKRLCEKLGEWFDETEKACKIYDIKKLLGM